MLARKIAEVKQAYEKPLLRRITLQQAKIVLRSKIKNFVRVIRPDNSGPIVLKVGKYEKPALKKLTPEQARLLLIGRANSGDEHSADLLYTIFNDPNRLPQGRL